ncbi:hypothetical protein [Rhizobium sp. SL42]|uniref:hypothetical protein n=1 Tax=Rhizobium sp. SL42 TaxID=2806346 RepID=UPI001F454563|nr:hypothetical protein [Rhizobium sp. SL42]
MPEHPTFDAIGFAGGGNRCYWQSGFFQSLNAMHPVKPKFYVAVSAGAYHCVMNVAGVGERARNAAFSFAEKGIPGIDWSRLRTRQSPLVVGALFRHFLTEQFGAAELVALKAAPPILIQLSRPPAWMPGGLAAIGSIAAYQLEKAVTSGSYSRAGVISASSRPGSRPTTSRHRRIWSMRSWQPRPYRLSCRSDGSEG